VVVATVVAAVAATAVAEVRVAINLFYTNFFRKHVDIIIDLTERYRETFYDTTDRMMV